MTKYPLVSIIIPTLNSSKTLLLALKSIQDQSYPQKSLEVIVMDGGSTDQTINIAKRYKCKIVKNDRVLQVFAKHKGTFMGKGKYIMHMDSDEVLENRDAIKKRMELFKNNNKVAAVIPSGYVTPKEFSPITQFVNEFGDPFSYFLYRVSMHPKFFIPTLKEKAKVISENSNGVVLDFTKTKVLPPLELSAATIIIDKQKLVKAVTNIKKEPVLISQTFFYFNKAGYQFGFTKDDDVLHYSVSSLNRYLKKLRSRVVNNVYKTEMGKSAFSGRDEFFPKRIIIKRYAFLLYSFTLVLPLLDGLKFALNRGQAIFLLFPVICLYISLLILFYKTLLAIGIKPKAKGYGV